ncbi:MAG: tRNA pseudouridine(55) synthase TruB [Candidatus Rokuibacteriota bacterium]
MTPVRSGVLVVAKAAGMTSFDVVALARKRLGVRRVGHGGTLDPDAVGVLPILIGEATKLMPYLVDWDKEYVVTVRLGVRTDTQDLGGRVLAASPVPPFSHDQIVRATRAFVGRIRQVPPMYSALHHGGRRLYELAREGVEVPREPREVIVHSIDVEEASLPTVTLRIVCGKGTYVRALAADIGETLGCGAAVERLERSRVGPFGLDGALATRELASAPAETVWARVLPAEAALAGWPVVRLDGRAASAFRHGQSVDADRPALGKPLVAVHAAAGGFLGIGEVIDDRVKPARIFHADHTGSRVLPA